MRPNPTDRNETISNSKRACFEKQPLFSHQLQEPADGMTSSPMKRNWGCSLQQQRVPSWERLHGMQHRLDDQPPKELKKGATRPAKRSGCLVVKSFVLPLLPTWQPYGACAAPHAGTHPSTRNVTVTSTRTHALSHTSLAASIFNCGRSISCAKKAPFLNPTAVLSRKPCRSSLTHPFDRFLAARQQPIERQLRGSMRKPLLPTLHRLVVESGSSSDTRCRWMTISCPLMF